ncbi:MAG: flagellar protein FliT [Pseudomonadota bacterium]
MKTAMNRLAQIEKICNAMQESAKNNLWDELITQSKERQATIESFCHPDNPEFNQVNLSKIHETVKTCDTAIQFLMEKEKIAASKTLISFRKGSQGANEYNHIHKTT